MRFPSEEIESLYSMTLDGLEEDGGDDSSVTGWFAKVTLTGDITDETRRVLESYDGKLAFIVRQSELGDVSALAFDSRDERDEAFEELERRHAIAEAGISQGDLLTAVTAYRAAALWSSTNEEGVAADDDEFAAASWSVAAQKRTLAELTDFIISVADDAKEFAETLGWAQLGHDFWLTRNHHDAGFWDRGLDELGQRLTEAAHSWGERQIELSDAGEFEVFA